MDRFEQTLQWGWKTSIELIPMQPVALVPQTMGREEQRVRKSSRETRREGERGMTEIAKKKYRQQKEKSWAPKHQRLLRARNEGSTQ